MRKFVTVKDDCTMIDYFPAEARITSTDFGFGVRFEGPETSITVFLMSTQAQRWHWHIVLSEIDGPIETREGQFTGRGVKWEHQLSRLELDLNMALSDLTQHWMPQFLPPVD